MQAGRCAALAFLRRRPEQHAIRQFFHGECDHSPHPHFGGARGDSLADSATNDAPPPQDSNESALQQGNGTRRYLGRDLVRLADMASRAIRRTALLLLRHLPGRSAARARNHSAAGSLQHRREAAAPRGPEGRLARRGGRRSPSSGEARRTRWPLPGGRPDLADIPRRRSGLRTDRALRGHVHIRQRSRDRRRVRYVQDGRRCATRSQSRDVDRDGGESFVRLRRTTARPAHGAPTRNFPS